MRSPLAPRGQLSRVAAEPSATLANFHLMCHSQGLCASSQAQCRVLSWQYAFGELCLTRPIHYFSTTSLYSPKAWTLSLSPILPSCGPPRKSRWLTQTPRAVLVPQRRCTSKTLSLKCSGLSRTACVQVLRRVPREGPLTGVPSPGPQCQGA